MEPFISHSGVAALIDRNDIDTDQIIPKQFLKFIGKTGFGKYLFYDWRFLDNGEENPQFELNKPQFKNASILVAGDNFGCGSSREHAPWALLDYGFRVIISTSFADIFWNNCFKNGILPITVNEGQKQKLTAEINNSPGMSLSVDLTKQQLEVEGDMIEFDVDPRRKEFLLKGLDDIKYTLQFEADIDSFEQEQKRRLPWLWQ